MVFGEYYNPSSTSAPSEWQQLEQSFRSMSFQPQVAAPSMLPTQQPFNIPVQPAMNSMLQHPAMNGVAGQVVVIRKPNEVFVGDLSYFCEEKDLFELFSQYGAVDNCRIVRNDSKNRSLMFGFVCMSNEQEAQAAAKLLNNYTFMGRAMKVELSEKRAGEPPQHKQPSYFNGYQVHVAFTSTFSADNLIKPSETFLRKFFIQYGMITDVVVREYSVHQLMNKQEGFGFVTFENEEAAVHAAHECTSVIVDGIVINTTLSYRNKPTGKSYVFGGVIYTSSPQQPGAVVAGQQPHGGSGSGNFTNYQVTYTAQYLQQQQQQQQMLAAQQPGMPIPPAAGSAYYGRDHNAMAIAGSAAARMQLPIAGPRGAVPLHHQQQIPFSNGPSYQRGPYGAQHVAPQQMPRQSHAVAGRLPHHPQQHLAQQNVRGSGGYGLPTTGGSMMDAANRSQSQYAHQFTAAHQLPPQQHTMLRQQQAALRAADIKSMMHQQQQSDPHLQYQLQREREFEIEQMREREMYQARLLEQQQQQIRIQQQQQQLREQQLRERELLVMQQQQQFHQYTQHESLSLSSSSSNSFADFSGIPSSVQSFPPGPTHFNSAFLNVAPGAVGSQGSRQSPPISRQQLREGRLSFSSDEENQGLATSSNSSSASSIRSVARTFSDYTTGKNGEDKLAIPSTSSLMDGLIGHSDVYDNREVLSDLEYHPQEVEEFDFSSLILSTSSKMSPSKAFLPPPPGLTIPTN